MTEDLSTVSTQYAGHPSRQKARLFPYKPKGHFHWARSLVAIVLYLLFFTLPFIKVHGYPLFLLDFVNRRFVLLGAIFWPQDLHLVAMMVLAFVLFIILFTVVYGRLWCGWACPQTLLMEMLYRKVEFLILGDAPKQTRLFQSGTSFEKTIKLTVKHIIFILISLVITIWSFSYFVGMDRMKLILFNEPGKHKAALTAIFFITIILFLTYTYWRERVCTFVCPYGRIQNVLIDQNTVVVAYDHQRGEPRLQRGVRSDHGDCVSDNLCVKVCPTGIDIRNGPQLECVNCTACIDACDSVMNRVGKEPGLIRYASSFEIESGVKKRFTLRSVGYSLVLVGLIIVVSAMLLSRNDTETTILRAPGSLYLETDDHLISNLYTLKMINKSFHDLPVRLELRQPAGTIRLIGHEMSIESEGILEGAFFVDLEKNMLTNKNTPVLIDIYSGKRKLETIKTSFLGP